jgi:ATP/maltotriose-dependent transcriptional regulator MalT
LQGRDTETSPLIAAVIQQGTDAGQGLAVMMAHWAGAVLNNGLGRYELATSAAQEVTNHAVDPWTVLGALPELVEAATRLGDTELAQDALDRLVTTTQPAGTDFAIGIETRSRALLSGTKEADSLFQESIQRLGRTRLRPEVARAHLLYGEWLRRSGRRDDAREQLRTAHEILTAIGMDAFAERSRQELLATGEKARKRTVDTQGDLTAQEAQIAQLARDGYSNPEIGAQLFLSPRTIEWHLRRVYMKLGISSRGELRAALTASPQRPASD